MILRSQTYVDALNVRPEQVKLSDVLFSLAYINRFNGHAGQYSVLTHSRFCAALAAHDAASTETQLHCLLHDVGEAYVGDVIRPIKHRIQKKFDFERAENAARAAVYEHLQVDLPGISERSRVRYYDDLALVVEALAFFGYKDVTNDSRWGNLSYLSTRVATSDQKVNFLRILRHAQGTGWPPNLDIEAAETQLHKLVVDLEHEKVYLGGPGLTALAAKMVGGIESLDGDGYGFADAPVKR